MAYRFGFADEDDVVDELPCNGFLVGARVAEIMDISENALQPASVAVLGRAKALGAAASDSGRGAWGIEPDATVTSF